MFQRILAQAVFSFVQRRAALSVARRNIMAAVSPLQSISFPKTRFWTNFHEFSRQLDRFSDEVIPKAVHDQMQMMALQALRGVVLKSPVDTGRFRANWQTSLGRPAHGTVDRTDKGGHDTISEGVSVIAGAQPFGTVWISNNLEYGPALEDGHSRQAPSGVVAVTLAEIRSQFGGR